MLADIVNFRQPRRVQHLWPLRPGFCPPHPRIPRANHPSHPQISAVACSCCHPERVFRARRIPTKLAPPQPPIPFSHESKFKELLTTRYNFKTGQPQHEAALIAWREAQALRGRPRSQRPPTPRSLRSSPLRSVPYSSSALQR